MVNRQDQLDIHCNLYDSSFVEYFLDDPSGQFDILFDQKLYEPARSIVDFEKRLQTLLNKFIYTDFKYHVKIKN